MRKRNRTDNGRATMATGKGVIQGYTGVDAAHQIIVVAQAHGIGSGQELLLPIVAAVQPMRASTTVLTADAGCQSEASLRAWDTMHGDARRCTAMRVDALIADRDLRQRDERCATQARHQHGPHPLHHKPATPTTPPVFTATDCTYDAEARACVCPAGKSLYRRDGTRKTKDDVGAHFRGAKRDCGPCPLRAQCLRTPDTTPVRNIAFFRGRIDVDRHTHTARMQARIDTPAGRDSYGQRFATVEPVFGNLRANKRLDRFALRGCTKVNGQWTLYCLVHNIEKWPTRPRRHNERRSTGTITRKSARHSQESRTLYEFGESRRSRGRRTTPSGNELAFFYSLNARILQQRPIINGGQRAQRPLGRSPHRR